MELEKLIEKFQQKDVKAFESLYTMYNDSIFGVIYTIVKNEDIATEILQDVFVKAWNSANSYNSQKGRFFTWLLNIARNAAIDKTRSKAFKNSKQNQEAAFFVDTLEDKNDFSSKVDAIGIKNYIEVLEPICKKVIHLLFFKGYTQKETAEELDIPLGTVKTRNRICINKLRDVLGVT